MKTKKLVRCALIAAIYAAISLALAPITYGPMQARVSEALTLLPIFTPDAILGVTLGCFLTNLVGVFTGANILGVLDIVFGTTATLCAAVCTHKLAKVRTAGLPLAAAIPPVLVNAIVIGAELTWLIGPHTLSMFLVQAAWVAVGQIVSCCFIGIPLMRIIEKTPALKSWFEE